MLKMQKSTRTTFCATSPLSPPPPPLPLSPPSLPPPKSPPSPIAPAPLPSLPVFLQPTLPPARMVQCSDDGTWVNGPQSTSARTMNGVCDDPTTQKPRTGGAPTIDPYADGHDCGCSTNTRLVGLIEAAYNRLEQSNLPTDAFAHKCIDDCIDETGSCQTITVSANNILQQQKKGTPLETNIITNDDTLACPAYVTRTNGGKYDAYDEFRVRSTKERVPGQPNSYKIVLQIEMLEPYDATHSWGDPHCQYGGKEVRHRVTGEDVNHRTCSRHHKMGHSHMLSRLDSNGNFMTYVNFDDLGAHHVPTAATNLTYDVTNISDYSITISCCPTLTNDGVCDEKDLRVPTTTTHRGKLGTCRSGHDCTDCGPAVRLVDSWCWSFDFRGKTIFHVGSHSTNCGSTYIPFGCFSEYEDVCRTEQHFPASLCHGVPDQLTIVDCYDDCTTRGGCGDYDRIWNGR